MASGSIRLGQSVAAALRRPEATYGYMKPRTYGYIELKTAIIVIAVCLFDCVE